METPAALDKLYSLLDEADELGVTPRVRLRLISIIGSLETEELNRFRQHYLPSLDENGPSVHATFGEDTQPGSRRPY